MFIYFKKILLILAIIAIGYALFIATLILKGSHSTAPKNLDTLIVLGAKVNGRQTGTPSLALEERLNTATDYLTSNPKTNVIVSGGQGADEPASEASVMKQYLIEAGIESQRIKMEDTSTRTQENISRSKELYPLGSVGIVTSDYHVYRGTLLAKRLGLTDVYGIAAPSTSANKYVSFAREIIALGYGFIFDR